MYEYLVIFKGQNCTSLMDQGEIRARYATESDWAEHGVQKPKKWGNIVTVTNTTFHLPHGALTINKLTREKIKYADSRVYFLLFGTCREHWLWSRRVA